MKRAYRDTERGETGPSGDDLVPPKMPKVSRKVHACTECQSRKIKCDLDPDKTICGRCSRKGLRCVVQKSLQVLLQDEAQWKESMELSHKTLQNAVVHIMRSMNLPPLQSFEPGAERPFLGDEHNGYPQPAYPRADTAVQVERPPPRVRLPSELISPVSTTDSRKQNHAAGMAMTRENSPESNEPETADKGLGSAPMGTLFEVTKLRNLRSNPLSHIHHPAATSLEDDFISSGKIDEMEAKALFHLFDTSLNHYLWGGIALVHSDLTSVRKSSTLLLAAILTVAALHIPGKEQTFDICYTEFVALVCDSMLDRYHSFDGIRALCIGAFWLSDLSWKLSGHAVRIATELGLHQSYSRALKGSQEHFEGARLWYLLYVCDHHFSIAYGRPPTIHENFVITQHERFLRLPGIRQADYRLHSQISMFIILTEIYHTFGPDTEQILSDDDLIRVRHFNLALDNWKQKWEPQLAPNTYVSTYPRQGVHLHQWFGKLQLNSLALRGLQGNGSFEMSSLRRDSANIAIACAVAILRLVLDEPDVRNALVGVPLYLHTMITYAAVFLLKVQQKWQTAQLLIETAVIRDLVSRTIVCLQEAKAGERHLTYHIAIGLSKMFDRFSAWERKEAVQIGGQISNMAQSQINTPANMFDMGNDFSHFGSYGDQMQLQDGQYFPLGFFDALSTTTLPE